jgi:hypothetical protein
MYQMCNFCASAPSNMTHKHSITAELLLKSLIRGTENRAVSHLHINDEILKDFQIIKCKVKV